MHISGKSTILVLASTTIAVLALALGAQSVIAATQDCFPDVSTSDWFHDFVCWMYDNGLVTGYPDGLFKPYDNVTRAELAVFAKGGYELAEANDDDTLAALGCAIDEVPKWSGSSWTCAADKNGPGMLKAAVFALCNPTPSDPSVMYREENNVNGIPITISDGASSTDGRCIIDFGFPVTDRYVVATARHPTTPLGVTVVFVGNPVGSPLAEDEVEIFVWHGVNGAATGGPIMVMVY